MAEDPKNDPGFTETDHAVPSDTMLAEGSHAPTLDGPTDAESSPPSSSAHEIESLPVVDRKNYAIGAPFAKGGIGQISAAMDVRLGRRIAIKELRRSSRYTRLRFAREIRITARLQHPNIVQLHEAGRWPNGEPFFAMQLVDGDSLEGAIASCVTREDHLRLVRHITDVADAMAHAHNRRIVHRDLKPGNVLVGPFRETVVIDWGLAKDLGEEEDDEEELVVSASETVPDRYKTSEGVVLGTPSYMPPEQAGGRAVDERADVYALGALLYQALSGRIPYFEYHPKRVLERVIAGPPTPLAHLNPDLPKDLLAIVDKAMSREPTDRYRTAARMAEELRRFADGRLVAAYDYSPVDLVKRFVGRHRGAVATALVGVLALTVGAAYSYRSIAQQRDVAVKARNAEEKAKVLEANARAEAERRLDQAIVAAAMSDLERDPTRAVARLKLLDEVVPGAASVMADAEERGVARRVLRDHGDRVDAVVYSQDGRYVASSGLDGNVYVFRREDGDVKKLEAHEARVPALAFAGDTLVSADYEGKVCVWDVAAAKLTRTVSPEKPVEIRALSVDRAGKRAATVTENAVVVMDLATGAIEKTFTQKGERAAFVRFSPKKDKLITGSHRGRIHVWDLAGDKHDVWSGHTGPVLAADVSADGARVVSAGGDGTVRAWSFEDGQGKIIGRHRSGANAVRFLDERHVVSGGMDGVVVVHDLVAGTSVVATHHEERVTAITTHAGRWIASAAWDKTTVIIDRETGAVRKLRGHDSVISALAFSPDGAELASASWDRTVRLWPTESALRVVQAHDVGVKTVAFGPTGSRIATGGHDDRVRVWDGKTGKLLNDFVGHDDHVFRVLFSPNGDWVASSSDDRTVRLWPVGEGNTAKERVLEGHTADVEELAFSRDGVWLASAAEDGHVGLWSVADGKGKLLSRHEGAITAIAFVPNAPQLVSASLDGTIAIFGLPDGAEAKRARLHPGGATGLAISDKGDIASVGRDDRVLLWDGEGEPRVLLDKEGVERVAITASGSMVAFATRSGGVGVCQVEPVEANAHACRSFSGHEDRVHALHFTAGDTAVVTSSEDGTVRIWSTETGESRPLRMHHAPVFDVSLFNGQFATASGDRTMAIGRIVPPPVPSALMDALAGLTELTLKSGASAAASAHPLDVPASSVSPDAGTVP